MITRRNVLTGAAAMAAMTTTGTARAAGAEGAKLATNDDGLFAQDWFHTSFLDMSEDLSDAAAQGKNLMILWEQRGCPYCRELHRVNFQHPEIRDFLTENFLVIQLNLWGDKEVTDFDGEVLTEKTIARKWYVNFTPTVILVNGADTGAATLAQAEAFRMPGYFKPFHFISGLEFAAGDTYRTEHFQRFIQARFDHLKEQGLDPDLW